MLVLEAGPDPGPLGSPDWPADLVDATRLGTSFDWGFDSAETYPDQVVKFERSRVIGGCSAHNGAVQTWGHRADYDGWAEYAGPGWTTDELLPYFERATEQLKVHTYERARADPLAGGLAVGLDRLRAAAARRPERARRDGRGRPRVGQHRRRRPLQLGLRLPRPDPRRRAADDLRRRDRRPPDPRRRHGRRRRGDPRRRPGRGPLAAGHPLRRHLLHADRAAALRDRPRRRPAGARDRRRGRLPRGRRQPPRPAFRADELGGVGGDRRRDGGPRRRRLGPRRAGDGEVRLELRPRLLRRPHPSLQPDPPLRRPQLARRRRVPAAALARRGEADRDRPRGAAADRPRLLHRPRGPRPGRARRGRRDDARAGGDAGAARPARGGEGARPGRLRDPRRSPPTCTPTSTATGTRSARRRWGRRPTRPRSPTTAARCAGSRAAWSPTAR